MTAATSAFDALSGVRGRRKQRSDPDFPTDPVRSHSYDVNDPRAQPGRKIGGGTPQEGKAFKRAMMLTIDFVEMQHAKGELRGNFRITLARAKVLKTLIDKLNHKTGQLDPSWRTLAAESGRSEQTVDRALEAGEHIGCFRHVRRSVAIEGAEGQRGPQRKQTSSAVYFDCLVQMEPDLYARFWKYYVDELAKAGAWFKQRARRLLNTFNSVAVPSPREPKVQRLVSRARQSRAADSPTRVPVEGRPGRPANIPTPPAAAPRATKPGFLDDVLSRMATGFGIDPGDILNEAPK